MLAPAFFKAHFAESELLDQQEKANGWLITCRNQGFVPRPKFRLAGMSLKIIILFASRLLFAHKFQDIRIRRFSAGSNDVKSLSYLILSKRVFVGIHAGSNQQNYCQITIDGTSVEHRNGVALALDRSADIGVYAAGAGF